MKEEAQCSISSQAAHTPRLPKNEHKHQKIDFGSQTVPRIHWGPHQCSLRTCLSTRAQVPETVQERMVSTASSSVPARAYLSLLGLTVACTYVTAFVHLLSLPTTVAPEGLFSHAPYRGHPTDSPLPPRFSPMADGPSSGLHWDTIPPVLCTCLSVLLGWGLGIASMRTDTV